MQKLYILFQVLHANKHRIYGDKLGNSHQDNVQCFNIV